MSSLSVSAAHSSDTRRECPESASLSTAAALPGAAESKEKNKGVRKRIREEKGQKYW